MKQTGTFLGLLCGFATGSAALVQAADPVPVAPLIQFAEPFHDFGRVQSGKIVGYDFIFTNISKETVEIADVESSCGCAAVTNWTRRVAPGQSGRLPILFNSSGLSGPVVKNLWAIFADTNAPAARFQFGATIWKVIDAVPQVATFMFGPDAQTNKTYVIRLVSNLSEPVTLGKPVCTNASFKAELKIVTAGKEFELNVTAIPPLPPGSTVAPITMTSSSPQMPEVVVNAYAVVQPACSVNPGRIMLPPPPMTETNRFVVRIQNNLPAPMVLSDATLNADGAGVRMRELQPGRLFELVVVFLPGFKAQDGQPLEVRVKSNLFQSPVIKVPVIHLETLPDE